MSLTASRKLDYGNWVPTRMIFVPAVLTFTILLAALSYYVPALVVLAVVPFLATGYFAYARLAFSPRVGNLQGRIERLVVDRVRWDGRGRALDVGCGNGPLTIALAVEHPDAQVVGIDSWGQAWEYARRVCERNAAVAGVAGRVSFERASPSRLPYDDDSFDLAVSNLVFHEVAEVDDKRLAVKEALRVLKKGGEFVFQDLFLWPKLYGEPDALVETVRGWGVEEVTLERTCDSSFIPGALKTRFMVGTIAILRGRK